MSFIPEENLRPQMNFNFAPMIDFLFLMLAFFATLAVSRASLYDTRLTLVKVHTEAADHRLVPNPGEVHNVNLGINDRGEYMWITEINDYPMVAVEAIQNELLYQYQLGVLPFEKEQTRVLLHIDKNAPWEPIARLVYGIQEIGFDARPIFEKAE